MPGADLGRADVDAVLLRRSSDLATLGHWGRSVRLGVFQLD